MSFRQSQFVRVARRWLGIFPLTIRGLLVAIAGYLAFDRLGLTELDLLALVLGVGALSTVAITTLVSSLGALRLRGRGVEPESRLELEAGISSPTGFELPSLRSGPLLAIEWTWIAPAVARCSSNWNRDRLQEEVSPRSRGESASIDRRISVGDVLGLTRIEWVMRSQRSTTILPSIGAFRRFPPVQAFAPGQEFASQHGTPEGDRMEIRPYVPGDSIRHILWRTFARTRQLDVRIPENSVEPTRRIVAYLVCGEADEAAAGLARFVLESGALGEGWAFGVDGRSTVYRHLGPALRAIAASAGGKVAETGGLQTFLQATAGGSGGDRSSTHCVVLAPPVPGPWLAEVTQTLGRFPGQLSVVVVHDRVGTRNPRSLFRRIVFRDPESGALESSRVEQTIATLAAVSPDVIRLDRTTGHRVENSLSEPR